MIDRNIYTALLEKDNWPRGCIVRPYKILPQRSRSNRSTDEFRIQSRPPRFIQSSRNTQSQHRGNIRLSNEQNYNARGTGIGSNSNVNNQTSHAANIQTETIK